VDIRDVRERRKLGFIPGSTHVPRGMLEFWLDPTSHYYSGKIDPTKRIIVYCAGGQRSALAADVLREMGFPNVAHLAVGFNGWAEAGRAVEREAEGRG
jgi:rhodanese-related sulfurtransferase